MKIVLDAMSGDNAPGEIVKGGVMAVKEFDCEIILVGDTEQITEVLVKEGQAYNSKISVVHSEGIVEMCDDPKVVLRQKRGSSLGVALDIIAKGEADAFVSAGNTGAVLTGATLIVKRIAGVRRAALAPTLPTKTVGGSLLIDSGANVECTEEYLEQFAIMGSIYCEKTMGRARPKVGLINNGSESSKGTPMIKAAHELLKQTHADGTINFIGNIEGRDVAEGTADVIVTDGFTGNILLKTYEGVGLYIATQIKQMFTKNIFTKIGALLVKDGINDFKKSMDYKEVGGAPMLGIRKAIIKSHGSCDAYAIRSSVKQAIAYKESGVIEDITREIAKLS
ncbi:MAG: phosphate acyltransferase PlsX [Clostridia bacterium]